MYRLFTLLLTSFIVVGVQSQNIVTSDMSILKDTVNVERYDDQNLQPLIGSTATVPFFHHSARRFWYKWEDAEGNRKFTVWDDKKGKYEVANTDAFDNHVYPHINPYGTTPDSLFRLSEDKNHNLLLEDLKTNVVKTLTTDGADDYVFEIIDVAWLDDNNYVIMRKDNRGVRKFSITYSLSTAPMHYDYRYETPGDSIIERQEYYLGNTIDGTLRKIDCTKWRWQTLQPQKAERVTDKVFFWRKKRSCDVAQLCTIDKNGYFRVLITEVSQPRINPDMFACRVVNSGKDIFLWSDRTGWGHYYHYDANGRLLNAVTSGNWTAGHIVGVDEKRRCLYLMGYGRENGRNPNYSFAYKVEFNGRGMRLLTPEDANHNIFVGCDNTLIVDTYSRVDMPPTLCVRDSKGKILQILERTDITKLTAYGWKAPEMIKVKAADGVTTLYGLMWKPYNFDANRKYPVISQVYPGPFTETVWNNFTVFDKYHNAALAQRGFIVVVFGHRGSSPFRDKSYSVYGYGNLRDYPLVDDKVGLENLALQYSFIDINKVGIVGHSGGGMMAAAAIMTYPNFYKVAVASSGNYDNHIYNRFWGENYQGITETGAFDVKTCAELAPRLKGHLLIVTGDADQNVHPAHTQRLVEALIQANKDFDLLMLPGQGHHYDFIHQQYFERRKRDFFEKWLK